MEAAEVAETIESARAEANRRDSAVLLLSIGDGPPRVSLRHDNVVHTAALAAAGASLVSR